MGVSQYTPSRELRRNLNGHGLYTWQMARQLDMERRERVSVNGKTPQWVINKALKLLREQQWSPRQISGHLLKTEGIRINHERIYRDIRRDVSGELARHCRHRMKTAATGHGRAGPPGSP